MAGIFKFAVYAIMQTSMNTVEKWIVRGGVAAVVVLLAALFISWWVRPTKGPADHPEAPSPEFRPVTSNTIPVDLSSHYNARLDQPWNRTSYPGDDLAQLPTGLQEFNGVRFDIHGVIQLQGREWQRRGLRYPEAFEGIAIGRACRYLYLLHADAGAHAPTGATVANLVLHYSDGTTGTIAIQHDIHVKDWWSYGRPPPSDPNTVVAWTGQNAATARMGNSNRLYMTRFENPHPQKKVETLDYVSAMEAPGPFMVGLTVE